MVQFQIQDFAFESLHFRRFSVPEADLTVEINQRIRVKGNLEGSLLSVGLSVEIGEPGLPFEVGVNLVGSFQLSEVPSQPELDQIIHVNCAAILFPFIREAIAELTRKGGIGPVLLPPLNFVQLHGQSKTKESETTAQPAK